MQRLLTFTLGALVGVGPLAASARAQETQPSAAPADVAPASMAVVTGITAVGQPLISMDGTWAIVREAKDSVVVFAVANPAGVRRSFPCYAPDDPGLSPVAPASKVPGPPRPPRAMTPWVWARTAPPAAFAEDSSSCIVASPDGITLIAFAGDAMTATQHTARTNAVPAARGRGGLWPLRWRAVKGHAMGLWSPDGFKGMPTAVSAFPNTVRWIENPPALGATAHGDHVLLAMSAADGSVTTVATREEIQAAVGDAEAKPLKTLRLLARAADGTLLIEAERGSVAPPVQSRGFGTGRKITPDEKPVRGRNPGSAEPPPSMPRYRLLKEDGRVKVLSVVSKARWLDTWIEAPSADLRSHLRLQVANDGGAGEGTPSIWTHLRMWPGEFEEHPLGAAGLKGLQAPQFEWIHSAADAKSGLVWMKALRKFTFDLSDPAVVQKYLPDLPALPPGAAGEQMKKILLMRKLERSGARGDSMTFGHFGVYRVESSGKLTPVVSGLGEAIGPFDDDTDLPGLMNRPAYCAATRTIVASLYSGNGLDRSRGLVIMTLRD